MPNFLAAAKGLALAALFPIAAGAHEFWIEPFDFTVSVGDKIEGHLKNGQFFKGPTYPYLPHGFSRFELATRSGVVPVAGRLGDSPALQKEARTGGLHVFGYASTVNLVNYKEFKKFQDFAESVGLGRIIDQHRAEGLDEDRVRETYYRYAKSLVKVGSGAGRDHVFGFPIELVAEFNPYSASGKDGVRFRLLWLGKPLPDWDVQVFQKAPGETEFPETHYTTDKTGRVFIPAGAGGAFLVNAVQITKPREADAGQNAQWESIWASTTYEIAPQ